MNDVPRRQATAPTKGGGTMATIVWNQPQDDITLDPRTCVVLALGEAKVAERACYAACRKDPTNRPLMTAWRHAKEEVTRREKAAVLICAAAEP